MVNLGSSSSESDSDDSVNEKIKKLKKRIKQQNKQSKQKDILIQTLMERLIELSQTMINLTKQLAELKEENIELTRRLNDLMNENKKYKEDTEDERIIKKLITTVDELIDINKQVVNEIEEVKEIKEQQNEIVTILEEDNRRNKRLSKTFSNKKNFSLSGEFAGGCLVGAVLGVAACLGALNFPIVGIGIGGCTLAVGIVGYLIFK
uniref:t-SNARE coiled-coil homology domain-containing protein n=1 Tax=Meloidogyne javanica TaxID=6303 RepID=A0A915LXQ1_MELJA